MSTVMKPLGKVEPVIEQFGKLKVDSLLGKKKHFNAADRKGRLRLWLTLPVVVINAALGSLLFSILQQGSPSQYKWLAAVAAFAAALLTAISTALDIAKQEEGHRRVGNKYLAVAKECDRIVACYRGGLIEKGSLVERLDMLAKTSAEVNQEAEAFPTNGSDLKIAQRGMKTGEEEYLEEELKK